MKLDALGAIATYWNLIPNDDKKDPTEDSKADEKFSRWLRDSSVWVPLKTFLKSKPDELVAAGYPADKVKSFLDAYRELEQAEARKPGAIDEPVATNLLTASRSLGESVTKQYPDVALIERETRFNALNPFYIAPFSYGTALLILVLTLACLKATTPGSPFQTVGRGAYWLGLGALAGGMAVEIYGFYLRIRISGWAPVTNMYETVIWVALVAATLALIFELVFRQVFVALAGSAVALLCTLTAASVPLLDPSIKSLQPVLRDNFWLGTHVLAVVSSYAAFGLAWGLGLLAMLFYLTATYRRSPRLGELALPLIPWLPVLAVGAVGVAAGYGMLGPQWAIGDGLFYVCSAMGLLGGMFSLASVLAVGGELVNRLTFRDETGHEEIAGDTEAEEVAVSSGRQAAFASAGGGVATLAKPTVAEIRAGRPPGASSSTPADWPCSARRPSSSRSPTSSIAPCRSASCSSPPGPSWAASGPTTPGDGSGAGTRRKSGRSTTLVVYLVPLHGRFAGWVNTFWLVFASVVCYLSVIMAWYGVNFVLGVGLHSYGFTEGGSQGSMLIIIAGVLALPVAAAWRRHLGYRPVV